MYKRFFTLLAPVALLLLGTSFSENPLDNRQGTRSGDEVGFIQQLYFLNKMKPEIKRVGVLWKKGAPNQEKKLKTIKRAVASIKGKLFLGYVQSKSDVPDQFRRLVQEHDAQLLWIVENDGIVDGPTPKQYLIENSVKRGVPLLAPSSDWVDAGAPVSIAKSEGKFQFMMNEPAAAATGLEVPSKYESQAKPVVAAN